MDNNKNETDNIELRSEKVRRIIGQVPPALVRTGTMIITLVVIALASAFYTIRYPITIEAQGKVTDNGSVELFVPYKYLHLFNEPRTVRVTLEGQDEDAAPIEYPIISHSDRLSDIEGKHYFVAKTANSILWTWYPVWGECHWSCHCQRQDLVAADLQVGKCRLK